MARIVPIAGHPAGDGGTGPCAEAGEDPHAAGACAGAESFVLMVLGDSMLPEFAEGEVVVVEPGGVVGDGSYVLARLDDDWTLRQLRREPSGWLLAALHPAYPAVPVPDLSPVRGVVIQKVQPGRRRETRHYVE